MNRDSRTFLLTCIVLVVATLTILWPRKAWSQAAKISMTPTRGVTTAGQGKVDIQLQDAQGNATTAKKDLVFNIAAPGTDRDKTRVTIPKGEAQVSIDVTKTSPAISQLAVEQAGPQSTVLGAVIPIGLSSISPGQAALPLAISLSVSPRSALRAGDTATLVAALVDANNVPVAATHNYTISFPGYGNLVTPYPLKISKKASYAQASITSPHAMNISLKPIVEPALEGGKAVVVSELKLGFENPMSAVQVVSEWGPYVETFQRPHIPLRIELLDMHNIMSGADRDRDFVVRIDPPTQGTVNPYQVTVEKNQKFAQTVYTPLRTGKVTITAEGSGLVSKEVIIEFQYRWLFFLLIAAVGGCVGAFVSISGDQLHPKQYIASLGMGVLAGMVFYAVAPLLVSIGLQPSNLQGSPSRVFEAFVWGLCGGFLKFDAVRKIFTNYFGKLTTGSKSQTQSQGT